MNKSQKCSVTQKGRVVIHKSNIEKRVYKDELDNYLNEGWVKGISESHNKNISNSHKGITSWNKGLTKETNSSIQSTADKLSAMYKGRVPWNKGVYGERNSFYGKKHSEETKQKISFSKIGHTVSQETRIKISNTQKGRHKTQEQLLSYLDKCYETRKKNNSFNSSKFEDDYYSMLCEMYGKDNIKRQYRDKKRYPFRCDFYIVSEDLFIELNLHWTHGGKPYNPEDEDCKKQLNEWIEKSKTSQFYKNAIKTWTVRDVKKQKCADENKLNYKVIY